MKTHSTFILPPPPDTDPDGVELQHVAQALRGAFVWATAVALTAFVAIGYLLATL